MSVDKIKVLYISGFGRSGSTLFGNVLGQVEGFFHGAELRHVWDRGIIENWLCGCGSRFRECGFWKEVFREAFGGMEKIEAPEMLRLHDVSSRTPHIPLMLTRRGKRLLAARAKTYPENLEKLYRAIQLNSGSRVIVDSSKNPSYGHTLSTLPGIDLYVVHLIRDPRAVTYSWLRKRVQTGAGKNAQNPLYMRRYTPASSVLRWGVRNVTSEMLWNRSSERYLTVRYEDFVARPQETVRAVLDLVQEVPSDLPFVSERSIQLGVSHTISGNPMRLQTGAVELRPDEEWRVKMRKGDRTLVTALTFPLLSRYGYLGVSTSGAPVASVQHGVLARRQE